MTLLFLAILASICAVLTFIMRKVARFLRNKGFYNLAHLIDGQVCNDEDEIVREMITRIINKEERMEKLK